MARRQAGFVARRIGLALGLAVLVSLPRSSAAQSKPPTATAPAPIDSAAGAEPKTKEQLQAQEHFRRAKDLYQTGSYREAIAELESARLLDPKAKDLVFNLGIVHEKLGKFDQAIVFFRQYMEMDPTASERAKAETIIKRIEGAKREVATSSTASPTPSDPQQPPPPEDKPRGRIDVQTIAAGSVAAAGLTVGALFGILAVSSRPGQNEFVTGRDGTYQDLQSKTDRAHSFALVADVGFTVGLVAAVVTAYLYLSRTKVPSSDAVVTGASAGTFFLGSSFQ